jgi:primosomal replication protein N
VKGLANTLNACSLTAAISELVAQRYTPAGIPAIDLILEHESIQIEAGSERSVKLAIKAIALGAQAERLVKLAIGKPAKFKGFLASSKNGKGILLHITDYEPI